MTAKRLFIISGEASGDLHGANLIKALKQRNPNLVIEGWGGDLMKAEGMKLQKHYKELAFMGFIEVLMNIRTILMNFKRCKAQISSFKPDAVIMIDYPGFNLRMAKWTKKKGIKSLYYISPQIWAWKQNRVHQIKANVDRMYTILPFESGFYKKFNVEVDYVGHPLLDEISNRKSLDVEQFKKKNNLSHKPIIAVLPGSRTQEIKRLMTVMLSAAKAFPNYQIVIAGAPGKTKPDYEAYLNDSVHLLFDQTYDLFKAAEAGWVTSGTATLEAALHRMPQVVVYKTSNISYQIAKRLVKIKYISLVNLIMDQEIVKELIQKEANTQALISGLKPLLKGGNSREKMISDYDRLIEKLGSSGASEKTAELMLGRLN